MKPTQPLIMKLVTLYLLLSGCAAWGQGLVDDNTERAALLALYNQTDGANWTKNRWELSQIQSYPNVTLPGVVVMDGDITSIRLDDSNLTGSIPTELNTLTELTYLSLYSNKLNGSIPTLSNLGKLIHLILYNNELSGSFPNWIGSLTNLQTLNLSGKSNGTARLTGPIPGTISLLEKLTSLSLNNNDFSQVGAIPDSFSDLNALRTLVLEDCMLQPTSINTGLTNLPALFSLNLSRNPALLTNGEFPNLLSNLPNLEILYLRYNSVRLLPSDFDALGKLNYLDLSNNSYSDPTDLSNIVDILKNVSSLKTLLLNSCGINNLPSNFNQLLTVENIHLDFNNSLNPAGCDILGNLPFLKNLYIRYCNLATIPENLKNSQTLLGLYASNNKLNPLTDRIKDIPNLEILDLSSNGIQSLPEWFGIGNMTSLTKLLLNSNGLVSLPVGFSQLINLNYLSINNNNLDGNWPSGIENLNQMAYLDLSKNKITALPDLTSWASLSTIYLQNNLLSGTLPGFLTNLTSTKSKVNINFNDFNDIESGSNFSGTNGEIFISDNNFTFKHIVQLSPPFGKYGYTPQDSVDIAREAISFPNGSLTLLAHVDTAASLESKFQWFRYKDGINDVALFNTPTHDAYKYTFQISESDYGSIFYYKVTNAKAPDLALTSRFISLIIACDILPSYADFITQQQLCALSFIPEMEYPAGCRTKSYLWNFGDGKTSIDKSPLHAYSGSGTYEVTLKVEYACSGCVKDTIITKSITFNPSNEILKDSLITVTTDVKSKVLATSASTFSDSWPLEYDIENLSENGFEIGSEGVWRNDATYVYNVPRNQSTEVDVSKDGTFSLDHFNWGYAEIEAIPNWIKANTLTGYSSFGQEIENQDVLGNYSSALYDYGGHLPSANGVNMRNKEMAFTSFEYPDQKITGNWVFGNDPLPRFTTYKVYSAYKHIAIIEASMIQLQDVGKVDVISRSFFNSLRPFSRNNLIKDNEIICLQEYPENPNWTMIVLRKAPSAYLWKGYIKVKNEIVALNNPVIDPLLAHSGKNSLKIVADKTFKQELLSLEPGKPYLLSAWVSVKEQNLLIPKLADNLGIDLIFKDKSGTVVASQFFIPSGRIIEGWQQIKGSFVYPGQQAKMELKFKPGSKGAAWYDDLRLHPEEGNMQTYVYDISNFRLNAILDEENFASFYYYDQEGNLHLVKKETEEGIKTISETVSYKIQNGN